MQSCCPSEFCQTAIACPHFLPSLVGIQMFTPMLCHLCHYKKFQKIQKNFCKNSCPKSKKFETFHIPIIMMHFSESRKNMTAKQDNMILSWDKNVTYPLPPPLKNFKPNYNIDFLGYTKLLVKKTSPILKSEILFHRRFEIPC